MNIFYLSDETGGQLLNRSETRMIESTAYDLGNPMKVIVHGWLGTTQEKEGLCSINIKCKLVNYLFGDLILFIRIWNILYEHQRCKQPSDHKKVFFLNVFKLKI